jgi:serine/threonine-protein kinase
VYLAREMQLDELVAVKVLRTDLAGSMLERFRDEVRLARRVTSPFVARTHDLAEHEGRFS